MVWVNNPIYCGIIIGRVRDKRKTALLLILIAIILLAILGKIILDRMNAPHEGVITAGSSQAATAPAKPPLVSVAGTYESFKYPSNMTVEANSRLITPVVEQFNFVKRDIESWNLAIAILHIPGGSLMANNAYQYRTTEPGKYNASSIDVNGRRIPVMTDTSVGGFSKVAFLVYGDYQATISLYGDDPAGQQPLADTFQTVLSSWQWK